MIQGRTKRFIGPLLGALVVLTLVVGGLTIKAEEQGAKETKVALPAEQVIASIKTAVAAKPGNVQEVEVENENGKTICEVEIVAQDGKTYEVAVNVATNTVIEVEVDDDTDEDEDDKN